MTLPTLVAERGRAASLGEFSAGAGQMPAARLEVTALIRDRSDRAAIAEALRGTGQVSFCVNRAHLIDVTAAALPRAVLVECRESDEVAFDAVVQELRGRFPATPLVAYCALTPEAIRSVAAAGRFHLNGVIIRGVDDVGVRLRAILAAAEDDCVAARVIAAVDDIVAEPVRPVLRICLRNARRGLQVGDVAAALAMSRQSLAERLARAKAPPASELVMWCRLLQAAWLLQQPGLSCDGIALELGFNASALRNRLRDYSGLRPTEIRARGGLRCLLPLFRDALVQQWSLFPAAPIERATPLGSSQGDVA